MQDLERQKLTIKRYSSKWGSLGFLEKSKNLIMRFGKKNVFYNIDVLI
jgi:hypothetical protein